MKKLYIFLLFFFAIILCSCEMTTPTTKEKRLVVRYFDNENIVLQTNYTKDTFELESYESLGYNFLGWYIDKDFNELFDLDKLDQYFEQDSLDLYAKMEKIMNEFEVSIIGLIDGETLLNPAFEWENNNEDETFAVTISQNGKVVFESECDKNYYQVDNYLEPAKDYEFNVVGKDSGVSKTVSFKTVDTNYNEQATITLANPFMDNMVIQRNQEIAFSGVGPKNQVIAVTLNNQTAFGVANEEGLFTVNFPAQKESFEAVNVVVTNNINSTKELSNCLIGDVYLFAGQSNMQWPTMNSDFEPNDISNAKTSDVRFFCQDVVTSTTPLENVKNGRWFVADGSNHQYFSAIAFMSGAMLGTALKNEVPIGIVTAYQGDTNIANWMSDEYYQGTCSTKYLHYNAMVYPLRATKLSGVVWYQGCNNSAAGGDYKELLLKFFDNYRDLFNNEELPFFVIGLACYDGDSGNNFDFSYVRESQALACMEDEDAYFISSCDDGDPTFIHPKTKRYICERVSKSIQSVIYGKNYASGGPTYKSHTVENNTLIVEFENASGLTAKGEITNLYLAGEDGKYYLAVGEIRDNKLYVTSSKVSNPVYVKYGFGKSPFVNIFNSDGFAITPFRTDSYGLNIDLFEYNSLSDYTFHPDGSAMSIQYVDNNLSITKQADGKTYGSVRLDKWGMVGYNPEGFELKVIGTNSNANVSLRFIEGGSYEIGAFKFVDDFTGEKTFNLSIADFPIVYNKQDGKMDFQKINYIELMIEANGAATITIENAKFVSIERSAPMAFSIETVSETENSVNVSLSKSIFAESYNIVISKDGDNFTNPVFEATSETPEFKVQKSLFEIGTPYYIKSTAANEIGSTNASNNGYVFYLKDENSAIVCNFDFKDQATLDGYIASYMSVHSSLVCSLDEQGVKITSPGAGWQNFIFKLDTGFGKGMTKLSFWADFSNYKGTVVLQLADTSWQVYEYNLDLSTNKVGNFTIDFSSFINGGTTPFTTQNLMWVMFNFNDNVGNGYILLDNVILTK